MTTEPRNSADPPELQEVDRLLDELGVDQRPNTVGDQLKSAILKLIWASEREGQRRAGVAIRAILNGDIDADEVVR